MKGIKKNKLHKSVITHRYDQNHVLRLSEIKYHFDF